MPRKATEKDKQIVIEFGREIFKKNPAMKASEWNKLPNKPLGAGGSTITNEYGWNRFKVVCGVPYEFINTHRAGQHRIYSRNSNYFSIIDTSEKAYWLGIMYTDGCVKNGVKENHSKTVNLEMKDLSVVEGFKNAVAYTGTINQSKRDDCYYIQITDEKMALDLIKLGVIPNKTYNHDTDIILPIGFELAFIKGCIDGDGSVLFDNNGHTVEINNMNVKLLTDIRDFIDSKHVRTKKGTGLNKRKDTDVWRYKASGRIRALKILQDIKASTLLGLPRKWDKVRDIA